MLPSGVLGLHSSCCLFEDWNIRLISSCSCLPLPFSFPSSFLPLLLSSWVLSSPLATSLFPWQMLPSSFLYAQVLVLLPFFLASLAQAFLLPFRLHACFLFLCS